MKEKVNFIVATDNQK